MNLGGIKVLMIGTDRNLFEKGSAVSERIKEYGQLVEELHIVVMSDKSHSLEEKKLSSNVFLYPTNSSVNFLRPLDAASLGKKIVFERKFVRGQSLITTQDPFECGWAGLKIKKKWRIPLEVQLHTDPFSSHFTGFQNRVRKFFARTVLANADGVRVVSENLKSRILNFKPDARVAVLPIFVDKEQIESAPIKFDLHARYGWHFIMLAVSRLAPEKNLSLALETLALVRAKFPGTGLIIVGSGPEEEKLKSLVKKLKLESAVVFAGWQNDLSSYYKTANVFIQTSLFEGYGLSLVEAGLSGLPIISTPVGIAEELEHGKDAYIYPVGNPEPFAEAVIELIKDNYKRKNMRLSMKRVLETKLISKEKYLEEMQAVWKKVAMVVR